MENDKEESTLDEIRDIIQAFIKSATEITFLTFAITVVYITLFCCKNSIDKCIINAGASIPLFILISTIIIDGKVRIMEWAAIKRQRRLRQEREFKEQLRAEGKAERDAEWIEWAANGKDPDKMPSKINPVKPVQKGKQDTFSDSKSN